MGAALHGLPERQLVCIGVGVIQETAFLADQSPGVDARAIAAVPPERTLSDSGFERGDGTPDVLALFFFGQLVVLYPAPAVAAYVVAHFTDLGRGQGIALERQGAPEHGHWQPTLLE